MIGTGIKRGTAELAVPSVLEGGAMHGYEMARRIEQQTSSAHSRRSGDNFLLPAGVSR